MKEAMQQELPSLFALAHNRTQAARIELAGKLADLFLSGPTRLNENEEMMVNELIGMLLKTEDVAVRHELVKRLGNAKDMPRYIAAKLAVSEIDLARAIIVNADSLTDDDLITIAQTQSTEHACAVASRAAVSEAVVDALVTTGSLSVMQAVAENLGAKLSPKAVTILSETARMVAALQEPIMSRPELTPDAATKLYWWVTQDVRRHAVERFGFSVGLLDLALAKAIDLKLNEHIFERHEDAAMLRVADWLEERHAISLAILPKLLRLGHFRLFSIALSRLGRLDVQQIDAIIGDTGGILLAALCRGISIDKPSFVSIFLLSRGARVDEHVVHPHELSHALAAYDKVLPNDAQNLLETWRTNPSSLTQYKKKLEAVG